MIPRRYVSLLALLLTAITAAAPALADPNKALQAFVSACLRSDVSLTVSRPALERAGVRSAGLDEGLFELSEETVKGTVYEVEASLVNDNRPYLVGCNVIAEGRFAKSMKGPLESQLASLGFSKIKGQPKGGRINGAKSAIFSVYQKDGQSFDIYVGDVSTGSDGKRTFLILGARP
jgi:hypothetical protein